jgi:outer membrane protein assembly factor BamE (lipoprotein component of BamABCDE complex)
MKKIISFLIVLLVLFACKKELVKEPKSLIEREKMVNIMYDLSLLEAMRMENPILMDSFKNNSNQYVFKKYKIDSVQFAQSNIFYAANYKEYEKMYNQVKSRIDLKKKQIDSVKKSENMKKMLKEKAKEKLKLKKEADSIKKAKLKTTKEKDSLKKGQ